MTGSIVKGTKQKQPLGQGSEGGSSCSHRVWFALLGVGDGFRWAVWRVALRTVLLCGAHQSGQGGEDEFCNTQVRNGGGLHAVDELLTPRMEMCHLAASKHQLTRSWGGSVSIPACPVLRDTAEDKAGSSHILPTRCVLHASPAIL